MLTKNFDEGRILSIMDVMNGMKNVMNRQETEFETGEAGATEAGKTKAAETVETSQAVESVESVEVAEPSESAEAVEATEEAAEALAYLHKRFPEVDDIELINLLEQNASSISDILEAKLAYEACSNCNGTKCRLPESLWRGYHVISLDERTQSNSNKLHTLRIGSTIGKNCKYDPLRGRFGELFHKSGLVKRQVYQTFETLEDVNQEFTMARIQAKKAAIEHSNIILAGRAGVGKTHLAVAIANYIMREEGRQARFRLVNELLDELRQAARYASDYLYVINGFKMTPCLILVDLGKEKKC